MMRRRRWEVVQLVMQKLLTEWILKQLKKVSKYMRFSYKGMEEDAIKIFEVLKLKEKKLVGTKLYLNSWGQRSRGLKSRGT